MGLREAMLSYRFTLFSLLYRYLYGVCIQRNDYVVVQQDWLRKAFQDRYRLKRVVVAHPSVKHLPISLAAERKGNSTNPFRFFYPAFSRSFKNVEVLLEAVKQLEDAGAPPFELRLTMDGSENSYARQMREQYGSLRSVQWMGALPRERVMEQYIEVDMRPTPMHGHLPCADCAKAKPWSSALMPIQSSSPMWRTGVTCLRCCFRVKTYSRAPCHSSTLSKKQVLRCAQDDTLEVAPIHYVLVYQLNAARRNSASCELPSVVRSDRQKRSTAHTRPSAMPRAKPPSVQRERCGPDLRSGFSAGSMT